MVQVLHVGPRLSSPVTLLPTTEMANMSVPPTLLASRPSPAATPKQPPPFGSHKMPQSASSTSIGSLSSASSSFHTSHSSTSSVSSVSQPRQARPLHPPFQDLGLLQMSAHGVIQQSPCRNRRSRTQGQSHPPVPARSSRSSLSSTTFDSHLYISPNRTGPSTSVFSHSRHGSAPPAVIRPYAFQSTPNLILPSAAASLGSKRCPSLALPSNGQPAQPCPSPSPCPHPNQYPRSDSSSASPLQPSPTGAPPSLRPRSATPLSFFGRPSEISSSRHSYSTRPDSHAAHPSRYPRTVASLTSDQSRPGPAAVSNRPRSISNPALKMATISAGHQTFSSSATSLHRPALSISSSSNSSYPSQAPYSAPLPSASTRSTPQPDSSHGMPVFATASAPVTNPNQASKRRSSSPASKRYRRSTSGSMAARPLSSLSSSDVNLSNNNSHDNLTITIVGSHARSDSSSTTRTGASVQHERSLLSPDPLHPQHLTESNKFSSGTIPAPSQENYAASKQNSSSAVDTMIFKSSKGHDSAPEHAVLDGNKSSSVEAVPAARPAPLFRGMKSRLRRALSFGNASELQQSAVLEPTDARADLVTPRKSLYSHNRRFDSDDEDIPEQDPIDEEVAARQEAAGLGDNIYSSQPGFSYSIDNVSVSSTASSASIMLRKMGRGMKRSTRSLRSLFKSKPMIPSTALTGANAVQATGSKTALGATSISAVPSTEVSTASVNAVRHTHSASGAQGSVDSRAQPSASSVLSAFSKNIASGNARSADRVAALRESNSPPQLSEQPTRSTSPGSSIDSVRKGILKHTSSVPSMNKAAIEPVSEAKSSRPRLGFRRATDFSISSAYRHRNRSVPNHARNITFNSHIEFYDVWSSLDYDRRGDIATCNRLNAELAAQIKEELNSFKLEMEVHELSRPNTQFF